MLTHTTAPAEAVDRFATFAERYSFFSARYSFAAVAFSSLAVSAPISALRFPTFTISGSHVLESVESPLLEDNPSFAVE